MSRNAGWVFAGASLLCLCVFQAIAARSGGRWADVVDGCAAFIAITMLAYAISSFGLGVRALVRVYAMTVLSLIGVFSFLRLELPTRILLLSGLSGVGLAQGLVLIVGPLAILPPQRRRAGLLFCVAVALGAGVLSVSTLGHVAVAVSLACLAAASIAGVWRMGSRRS